MANIAQLLTEYIDIWTSAESEKKSGRGNTSSNTSGVYGVKKLRELILELAISGKIVNSEESWKQTKLGDLGAWAIGGGFPTTEQGSQSGNILFAKVSDMNNIGNEKFIFHTNNTITEEVAKKLKANIHPEGTVIFPKIGGAIATNKRRILVKPTAIDNNCLGITPQIGVTTDWLYLILSAIDLSKYQAGTSVPALAQGVLQEIQVMLPSVSEQQRVVAKVDDLMALCDQLEQQHSNAQEAHEAMVRQLLATLTQSQNAAEFNANWQRIYAHFDVLFTTEASIDALKQTLLQLAVMGKLVPQDPFDEPASELLKRIQAEKAKLIAEGKLKKEKSLAPIGEDEKPFEMPKGWEWARLNEVIDVRDGTHDSPKEASGENTYPLVTSKDFIDGKINFESAKRISAEDYHEISKRSYVEKYDILFSMIGGNIGNQVIVNDDRDFSVKNVALFKYYDRKLTLPIFVKKYTENLAYSLQSTAVGGAQPFVALGALRNLVFALPPLAEQYRIVAKLDEVVTLCDQLKTRLYAANQQQQKLADAMIERVSTDE